MDIIDLKMILACDNKWGIGVNNDLLSHIPEDLKFFREKTYGGLIIIGRKTADSFPGGKALKGRINVMISATENSRDGYIIVRDLQELFSLLETGVYKGKSLSFNRDRIYVSGGGTIYSQLLPYTDTVILTKMDAVFEADTFFVNLDEDKSFEMTSESEIMIENGIKYKWCEYKRVK